MRVAEVSMESVALEMGEHELGLLINASLEAKRMLRGESFEAVMGVPRAELTAVEDVLYAGYRAMIGATDGTGEPPQGAATMECTVRSEDAVTLWASRQEITMLVDAFVQADRLVKDWDFPTIVGVTKVEFAVVKDDLMAVLRAMPDQGGPVVDHQGQAIAAVSPGAHDDRAP